MERFSCPCCGDYPHRDLLIFEEQMVALGLWPCLNMAEPDKPTEPDFFDFEAKEFVLLQEEQLPGFTEVKKKKSKAHIINRMRARTAATSPKPEPVSRLAHPKHSRFGSGSVLFSPSR